MTRPVTERDLRMPEFRDADVADLEFRDGDGKVVRKDRWETGFRRVANAMGCNARAGFEIDDVVDKVVELAEGLQQAVGDDIWADLKEPTF